MFSHPKQLCAKTAALLALAGMAGGCHSHSHPPTATHIEPPRMLGLLNDNITRLQEANAEASDFVIYEHEFQGDSARLNEYGQDHIKQIAARVARVPFPIVVEKSKISPREGTVHGYPVHSNEALDLARRDVLVQALSQMGVNDAERRVVVGYPYGPGYTDFEAERAYGGGISSFGGGGGGGAGGGFF